MEITGNGSRNLKPFSEGIIVQTYTVEKRFAVKRILTQARGIGKKEPGLRLHNYEAFKAQLQDIELPAPEYEQAVRQLSSILGV